MCAMLLDLCHATKVFTQVTEMTVARRSRDLKSGAIIRIPIVSTTLINISWESSSNSFRNRVIEQVHSGITVPTHDAHFVEDVLSTFDIVNITVIARLEYELTILSRGARQIELHPHNFAAIPLSPLLLLLLWIAVAQSNDWCCSVEHVHFAIIVSPDKAMAAHIELVSK